MKKMMNTAHVEGYVFSHSNLSERVCGPNSKMPGAKFISGTLKVCTDDQGVNVIPVHFNFVAEKTKAGKDSETFATLKEIIESDATFEKVGTNAIKVRIDGDISVNDFMGRDGEMVAAQVVRGSFIHLMTSEISDNPAFFKGDMLVSKMNIREVEDGDDYLSLEGFFFDFRGGLVPVKFSVSNADGIEYFESQEGRFVVNLWGDITTSVVTSVQDSEEVAFGAARVVASSRSFRVWDIVGCSPEILPFDSEESITKAEMKEALAAREAAVAAEKARREAYEQSKNQQKSAFGSVKSAAASVSEDIDDDDFEF